jgi:predicted DsbA family dithiol-disulfide isomerase
MKIDIISDTICPWCYIGEKKFDRAVELVHEVRPDVKFDVRWRPFQLHPETPKEGVDRKKSMKRKFGDGPHLKAMSDTLRAAGSEAGINFNFEAQDKTPNTLNSHRLIRWSESAGCQPQVVEALFQAYFIEGRDIGETRVLVDIAGACGMDAKLVADLLAGDTDIDLVTKEDVLARERGITGVPTFVINDGFMIGGAQDPETLCRLFLKVVEKKEARAAESIALQDRMKK